MNKKSLFLFVILLTIPAAVALSTVLLLLLPSG